MSNAVFNEKKAWTKLVLILFIFCISVTLSLLLLARGHYYSNIVAKAPLNFKSQAGFGGANEPKITAQVSTKNGPVPVNFLIDSGSTISSLPYNFAALLGFEPSRLKRLAFRGYGNTTTFAYQANMSFSLGKETISIPVVFTESENTTPLLGRKGFFENYIIIFNNKENILEIRR